MRSVEASIDAGAESLKYQGSGLSPHNYTQEGPSDILLSLLSMREGSPWIFSFVGCSQGGCGWSARVES